MFGTPGMKQIALCMFSVFFLLAPLCGAQEKEGVDHLFSLDLSYSLTGFLNQGWGIGAGYEEKLLNCLSVKGTIGHMTFLTGIEDVYCTSVNISLSVNYYPFGNGLDKLYTGLGSGCDFMNYFGKGEVPATAEDILISLTPGAGWKFITSKYFMMDISAGYKFVVVDAFNYHKIKDYTNAGLQVRLGFKIFFKEIFKKGGEK
ncbi:MAG: hypothetical protein LBK66_00495 [Spirochaetaceae bacterium]|jgi:hypothetical protein|nr:hypothetical protein [Spirochaetaceae bacterium]